MKQEHAHSDASKRESPIRLAILVSGGGRTLQNIHDQISAGQLNATVACVISSRADAYGLQRARDANLPAYVVLRKQLPDDEFNNRITSLLNEHRAELVCMGGFNCLWQIPSEYDGRVLNIHPALLPSYGGQGFYGKRVHQAVLDAGEKESGCTVHYCDNEYDHGPIILQRKVPVLPEDTVESLAARVFEQECIAYPEAIRQVTSEMTRE